MGAPFVNPSRRIDRVVLITPAYNEAASISELMDRAAAALSAMAENWSVIVVDDGSSDATASETERAIARHPRVRLVKHSVNKGLGPAIMTGMLAGLETAPAEGLMVAFMDADLTHPPETLPAMRAALEEGADIVIASRYQPGSETHGVSAFRLLLSWGARRVFQLAIGLKGVNDYTCGFRAFHAPILRAGVDRYGPDGLIRRRGFACTDELLVKLFLLNPVIREIPFVLRYDLKRGKSKIRLGVTIMETIRLVQWARREIRSGRKDGGSPPKA